jgi:hypothetical protein
MKGISSLFFSSLRTLSKVGLTQGLRDNIDVRGILIRDLIPFLAGAVLAKLTEYLIDSHIRDESEPYLRMLLLIAIVLSFMLLIFALRISLLTRVLQASRVYNVFLHRDHYVDGKIRKGAFSFCTAAALKARKSIIVMGPHFEGTTIARSSDETPVPGTESHDLYLEEGMNAAIERHVRDDDSDFRYERIVQMEPQQYRNMREKRECADSVFNNQELAIHVHEMLKRAREAHTAEITMYARPYVASFPSTLVIDDRYVFFSLPTGLVTQEEGKEHPSEYEYKYDMVLGIEDLTGEIPTLFRQVILQFKKGGCEIEKVILEHKKKK